MVVLDKVAEHIELLVIRNGIVGGRKPCQVVVHPVGARGGADDATAWRRVPVWPSNLGGGRRRTHTKYDEKTTYDPTAKMPSCTPADDTTYTSRKMLSVKNTQKVAPHR